MSLYEAFTGKKQDGLKSRMPAKLDYLQSATGLFLGLFMIGHMLFVSTILISNDAFYNLAKFFEASFICGINYRSCTVVVILIFQF